MYTDQIAPKDMSRDMAARHGFPIYPTVAEALSVPFDAVLLIGAAHHEALDGRARCIANRAVALIDALVRGAAIARYRHPAGIGDEPPLAALMADHGGQDRKRDVVHRAAPELGGTMATFGKGNRLAPPIGAVERQSRVRTVH